MHRDASPADVRPRVTNAREAATLIASAHAALDTLQPLIVEETAFMREGRLKEALALADSKAEAGRTYTRCLEALKHNAIALSRFQPGGIPELRSRHQAFSDTLGENMAVLATVRMVSESIVRELAAEVGQARQPAGYGAGGRMNGAYTSVVTPLAVSREL
jgi:hypothetical protein